MPWKDGKRWVYSITYDEGCEDLLKHAVPLHRKYGIPGHVAMVASQVGVPRDIKGSTYNGMMILSKEQVQGLVGEGWGVSCHSMTHPTVTVENGETEVLEAKRVLEDKLELPVPTFCIPGSNAGLEGSQHWAPKAGYQAIYTIFDRVNTPETDLMCLGRVPLHTEYPGPFFSVFDRFKRIHQAIELGGWIIDYCHCPVPGEPIHPAKDCTSEELEERFRTVVEIGGDDVWLAEPNEVVAYLLEQAK